MAAHRPQEILGAVELAQFRRAQEAGRHQIGGAADVVRIFADPEEGVQVAQAPLPFLDIGFDDIARVTQPLVPRVAFGQLFGDEGPRGPLLHLVPEPLRRLGIERGVAPDIAPFDQRGAHRHIGFGLSHHLVERPRRMADLQPQVPKRIKRGFNHLFGPGRLLPRGQHADIDVRMGRHFPPSIAADRDQRHPLGRGRIMVRMYALDDEAGQRDEDRIGQIGIGRRRLQPMAGIGAQSPLDLASPARHRVAQHGSRGAAQRHAVAGFGRKKGERLRQRHGIDDRLRMDDPLEPRRGGEVGPGRVVQAPPSGALATPTSAGRSSRSRIM